MSGTVRALNLGAGPAGSYAGVARAAVLDAGTLFCAAEAATGAELWTTDGTGAGTHLVADLASPGGSSPTIYGVLNGKALFSATTATAGTELWSSDGTGPGTALVADVNAGAANGFNLNAGATVSGGRLFFQGITGAGTSQNAEPWTSDGTTAGTSQLANINAAVFSTTTGGLSSNPTGFRTVGALACFGARTGASANATTWCSDGTTAGTLSFGPSVLVPSGFVPGPSGDMLFAAGSSTATNVELFRAVGRDAGLLADLEPGTSGSSPSQLTATPVQVFFTATTSAAGTELWRSDGTDGGTSLVLDIVPGPASSSPTGLTPIAGTHVLFAATTAAAGTEPWVSDGTDAGTALLVDVCPGPCSSSPSNFFNVGSFVYFAADDGVHGSELWRTDGTASGTVLVADLAPGELPSFPQGFFKGPGRVHFWADDGDAGRELWGIALDSTPPVVTPSVVGTSTDGGWYISDVAVSFTVSEPDSPSTVVTTQCAPSTVSTDTTGQTFTCVATSEGGTTTSSVTVRRDATAPVLTCPADVAVAATSGAGAVVSFPPPAVVDLVPAAVALSSVPNSGTQFPLGASTVTFTGVDLAGRTGQCTFAVSVTDQVPPVITCPSAPAPTEATSPDGGVVSFAAAVASDDVDEVPAVASTQDAGTVFPLGTTMVTETATDRAGHAVSCSFDVEVVDTTPPQVLCPGNLTVEAHGTEPSPASFPSATAADVVDPTPAISYSNAPGSTFPVGDTTVTVTATDFSNNRSAPCTFTVTVQAGVAPVLTCPKVDPVTATQRDGQSVEFSAVTASDGVDGPLTVQTNHQSGDVFPVGTTTVTATATDRAGNEASCSFDVVVTPCTSATCQDVVARSRYAFGCAGAPSAPFGLGWVLVALAGLAARRRNG